MNYRELHEVIMTLTEDQVLEMLEDEQRNQRRKTFLVRLHQRYSALRAQREREELEHSADS